MNSNLPMRIEAILAATSAHPFLGKVTERSLCEWIKLELGGSLGHFAPYGTQHILRTPYSPILHVVSGNTPHAAIQTLTRGILVGAQNRIKIPSSGLPELDAMIRQLPESLRPEYSDRLEDNWIRSADALVVFGSDDTIRNFQRQLEPWQVFLAHGHKLSLGMIAGDHTSYDVKQAAIDTVLFDQSGCLSPQYFFVEKDPKRFAQELAQELDNHPSTSPVHSQEIAAQLRGFREDWRFQASLHTEIELYESRGTLDWTVIYDGLHALAPTPLHRTVFVKPIGTAILLRPFKKWIGTVGINRLTDDTVARAIHWGAQRICGLGQMQYPPLTWHHDGWPSLASLTRVIDLGFR
jgi:hypothetical protein